MICKLRLRFAPNWAGRPNLVDFLSRWNNSVSLHLISPFPAFHTVPLPFLWFWALAPAQAFSALPEPGLLPLGSPTWLLIKCFWQVLLLEADAQRDLQLTHDYFSAREVRQRHYRPHPCGKQRWAPRLIPSPAALEKINLYVSKQAQKQMAGFIMRDKTHSVDQPLPPLNTCNIWGCALVKQSHNCLLYGIISRD